MEDITIKLKNIDINFDALVLNIQDLNTVERLQAIIEENSLLIYQQKLKELFKSRQESIQGITDSESLSWILNDVDMLKYFLTSGDVIDGRWLESIQILVGIANADPIIKTSSYRKRLAAAVALTFSTPVTSLASYKEKCIDPLVRYLSFAESAVTGKFFPQHMDLSTWELRHVVSSWAEEEELEWARQNVLPEFKSTNRIGEATHKMIQYTEENVNGVSVQDGAAFYDFKACTLAILKEYGAVCGGVSKFGTAMTQAFGIPACLIGQPGHCAFLWWMDGEWKMSNGNSGITESHIHSGVQWTWGKRADFMLLFQQAQNAYTNYVLSEQVRWLCQNITNLKQKFKLLVEATAVCSSNYLLWKDLLPLCASKALWNQQDLLKIQSWLFERLKSLKTDEAVISAFADKVTANNMDNVKNVIDRSSSEWYCREKEGWIEIDLDRSYTISAVEIQWWGISYAKQYCILYAGDDGVFHQIKDEKDAICNPTTYNEWSKFTGWSQQTTKVKIVLKDGCLDHWNMNVWIGLRQFNIFGRPIDDLNGADMLRSYLEVELKKNFQDFPIIGGDLFRELRNFESIVLSRHAAVTSSVPEQVENVIDGTNSEWYCRAQEAWIELDIEALCKVTRLDIQWWGYSYADTHTISYAGLDGDFHPVRTEAESDVAELEDKCNEWTKFDGWSFPTKKIRIFLGNGHLDPWGMNVLIGIRQINVMGRFIS